jgi:2-methylcitrate dehydratase PrpD
MATATQELIHNMLDVKYENFDAVTIRNAKNQIIDLAAVMVSGWKGPANSALFDLVRQWGGKGEATILGNGDKVPLPHAAMMNSLQGRSYDHEAVGPYPFGQNKDMFCGHVESSTVPAAFSVAEYTGASGKDLLSAVVLGGDLAARVIFVEGVGFNHPFDPVGTGNSFGVAGIAGRLLGLNEAQMMHAFGILTTQVAGNFRSLWDGVHTFKLYGAMAARNGIICALMAQKGFTGLKDPLFGPQGYFESYCPKPYHPEYMNRDLGKEFYTQGMHKKYPSCYGNHNLIDCGLDILKEHDINAKNIKEIIIGIHPMMLNSYGSTPFRKGDLQPAALFYQSYSAANVLLRKGARLEHYTEEAVQDPEVIALCGRVKHEPTSQKNGAMELIVKMNDGKEYKAVYQYPMMRGYPARPLTPEELIEKYWNNINFCGKISRSKAEKALDMIQNLEKVDHVTDLIKLLVAG